MPFVEGIPAMLRVFMVFVLMLIGIRRKLSLGNAFVLGAIALGLIFGLKPGPMLWSFLHSLSHPKTVSLALVVSLILVLSHSMELGGQMRRLLTSFQGLVSNSRANLVIFPALIGLLPMPGGAIFSAPMVRALGADLNLSGAQLSYVNYWFRHIWEYWWPLYPGVLLTTTLADMHLWLFVVFLCPLTAVALCLGYWPIRHMGPRTALASDPMNPSVPPNRRAFFRELAPIAIVIVLGLGLGMLLPIPLDPFQMLRPIVKEIGLIIALIVAIGTSWHQNSISPAQQKELLTNPQLLRLFYMVAAILIFKGVLEDSHAVAAISEELLEWHIPLVSITVVLPLLVGSIVGITIAFVGTTFPILIPLIQSVGEGQHMLSYMMLALVSGFVGVLLSPLHLCLLLSNEYFATPMQPVYRNLWLPCSCLLLCGILYFWILRWLGLV